MLTTGNKNRFYNLHNISNPIAISVLQ